ncbi:head-tail adaptor protein [Priestia megaterium]|nr:head-tail adaptor protein [Priestia megaterium]
MGLNFKHRISIVELKANPGPEPGTSEQEFTKAWADIKTMKGREYNESVIAGNLGISRFIIRYIPNIKANMKVKYKGNVYDIESITNDDEQNRTITIIGKAIL